MITLLHNPRTNRTLNVRNADSVEDTRQRVHDNSNLFVRCRYQQFHLTHGKILF